jgi:hypothetical protein
MRLAWFRATRPDSGVLLDRTAAALEALRGTHTIDVITAAEAHDFVWKHGRQPYNLCIYEVGNSPAHQFVTPYLLHYPGVAFLSNVTTPDPRTWSGSRLVVVSDVAAARALAAEWPAARLRHVPPGVRDFHVAGSPFQVHDRESQSGVGNWPSTPLEPPRATVEGWVSGVALRVGTIDASRHAVVERAVQRAQNAGAAVHVCDTPVEADVIVAREWPPTPGPPLAALHAMAAGRPVIVLEVEVTAGWPALDPQTWQPRGFSTDPPIVVSLDPRDEEHSLMLALVRLAADPRLRSVLGAAARTWWHAHATIDHAVAGWEAILSEAATLGAAAPEQVADGSEQAREILAEMGVQVDFL